ncbi:MAG: trypsin-like peptidase domain-containing protein [Patescibacteria group bacterium]
MTNSIPQIIKKIMPAVVSIVISKKKSVVEKEIPQNMAPIFPWEMPEKHEIPEELIDAHGMVKIGSGSGFIVHEDGIIITNKHVVADNNAEYVVYTDSGDKYPAEILARDPIEDIAILKIGAKNLPVVKLGDSSILELGLPVLAIGNALGLFKNTVSYGIVSGLSRSIQAAAPSQNPNEMPAMQELRGLIQTDAAINPGNSGGPLVNMDGEVIGINAAVVFGAQNLNFTLPINSVKRDLEDLKKHGRITRPMIGLRYITIDDNMKEKMKLAVDYGALVIGQGPHSHGVVPHSPAHKAGLRDKDIILECNGEKITREKTIQDFLEEMSVGDNLDLKVLRDKKEFEVKVLLAERK